VGSFEERCPPIETWRRTPKGSREKTRSPSQPEAGLPGPIGFKKIEVPRGGTLKDRNHGETLWSHPDLPDAGRTTRPTGGRPLNRRGKGVRGKPVEFIANNAHGNPKLSGLSTNEVPSEKKKLEKRIGQGERVLETAFFRHGGLKAGGGGAKKEVEKKKKRQEIGRFS